MSWLPCHTSLACSCINKHGSNCINKEYLIRGGLKGTTQWPHRQINWRLSKPTDWKLTNCTNHGPPKRTNKRNNTDQTNEDRQTSCHFCNWIYFSPVDPLVTLQSLLNGYGELWYIKKLYRRSSYRISSRMTWRRWKRYTPRTFFLEL